MYKSLQHQPAGEGVVWKPEAQYTCPRCSVPIYSHRNTIVESCKVRVSTADAIKRKAEDEGKWEEVNIRSPSHQRRARKANNKAASVMAPRQDTEPTFKVGTNDIDNFQPERTYCSYVILVTIMAVFCHLDTNLDTSRNKDLCFLKYFLFDNSVHLLEEKTSIQPILY